MICGAIFTVDGAFDFALEGVTHIIHAGSPVPVHPCRCQPMTLQTQVYEPT